VSTRADNPEKAIKNEAVVIYTDGGSVPNPGAGGWAAVLEYKGKQKELVGGEAHTTNNRMELTAAIEALESLKRACKVILYTDSEYVRKGITEWMKNWKKNNWRTRGGAVKNKDLWIRLDAACQQHEIEWRWVPGHAGIPGNERCDELAGEQVRKFRNHARGL